MCTAVVVECRRPTPHSDVKGVRHLCFWPEIVSPRQRTDSLHPWGLPTDSRQ